MSISLLTHLSNFSRCYWCSWCHHPCRHPGLRQHNGGHIFDNLQPSIHRIFLHGGLHLLNFWARPKIREFFNRNDEHLWSHRRPAGTPTRLLPHPEWDKGRVAAGLQPLRRHLRLRRRFLPTLRLLGTSTVGVGWGERISKWGKSCPKF